MESLAQYEGLIAIIAGIFLCLFGYRIKKIAFVLIWFIIGFYLMSLVAPNITPDQTIQLILCCAAGLLLSVLGFSIEKFCIFAVATFTVSTTLIETFQFNEPLPIILCIVAGLIVGGIATALIKPFGIITTSLSGAKLIAKYTSAGTSLTHEPWFLIILVGCCAIGILFQMKTCRHIE